MAIYRPASTPIPACVPCLDRAGCAYERARGPLWRPFRFPSGAGHYYRTPCEPPVEVTVNGSWLPVSHIGGERKGPTSYGGLWFYYARGCSDLFWRTGRTLLAINRAHAALLLEQRIRGGTDEEAAARVAAWMNQSKPFSKAQRYLHSNSPAAVIGEAARGLHGECTGTPFDVHGSLRPCVCRDSGHMGSSWRAGALYEVSGHDMLSAFSARILKLIAEYDTVILYKQPQGAGNPLHSTIEMWDIRMLDVISRNLEDYTQFPEFYGQFMRRGPLNWTETGTTASMPAKCEPGKHFRQCFSCAGSHLEALCGER